MNAHHRPRRELVTRADQLEFDPRGTPPRARETRVLMAAPDCFGVEYVINPHMAAHVGAVDREKARREWQTVTNAYRTLGFDVHVLPAIEGLPDLVFTANQSFPVPRPDGRWDAVMSHMKHRERAREVDTVAKWHVAHGAMLMRLSGDDPFEGMGDALWLPGHRLVLGGYGFRTGLGVYAQLAELIDAPVLALRLVDERFYHLDTCLSPIDPQTALYVPGAFDSAGRALLEAAFPRLIAVPEHEATGQLSCNGHCPDGRHFLVQSGSHETVAIVRALGLEPVELDTSEFLKSGGSVFCMKLMLP